MTKLNLTALAIVLGISACSAPKSDRQIPKEAPAESSLRSESGNSAALVEPGKSLAIPDGWAMQWTTQGDLNADGIADHVLILKRSGETGDGPRRLLITFGKSEGADAVAADTETFLPTVENGADPLATDNPLSVKRGALQVYVEGTATAISHETFTFRYQNSAFELIGYDASNQMRATGDFEETSINYSTRNFVRTVGNIGRSKEKVSKGRLPDGVRPSLTSIDLTKGFVPEDAEAD